MITTNSPWLTGNTSGTIEAVSVIPNLSTPVSLITGYYQGGYGIVNCGIGTGSTALTAGEPAITWAQNMMANVSYCTSNKSGNPVFAIVNGTITYFFVLYQGGYGVINFGISVEPDGSNIIWVGQNNDPSATQSTYKILNGHTFAGFQARYQGGYGVVDMMVITYAPDPDPLPTTRQEYLDKLLNGREYNELISGADLWQEYQSPGTPANLNVYASWAGDEAPGTGYCYAEMLNDKIRAQFGKATPNGNTNFIATIPNVIDTSCWMDSIWEFIKVMPANQCLFPGCHDALTGYPKNPLLITTGKSKTQENQTITQMLNAGARFLDIRFEQSSATDFKIEDFVGVHGGPTFEITVEGFAQELNAFLNNGKMDVVILYLMLYDYDSNQFQTPSTKSSAATYKQFISYVSGVINERFITNGNPSDTLEELTAGGRRVILVCDTDVSGDTNSCWSSTKWVDDANFNSTEVTPQEWYSVMIEGGYLTNLLPNDNVFHILSMTQTNGDPINSISKLNGPLADWLLYATPDYPLRPDKLVGLPPAVQDQINGFAGGFILPYKPYTKAGGMEYMRNYNVVSMDFYNSSPFIINAITQNLVACKAWIPNT